MTQLRNRVVLINAPIDDKYRDSASLFCPPLGLLSIKAYLEQQDDEFEIILLDGMILDTDTIVKRMVAFHPNIVGTSVQLLSYKNAVNICHVAKQQKAFVFVGGHHATQMATKIMERKHNIIDCVVCGDGEIPVYKLCLGIPLGEIPGTVCWDRLNEKVHITPMRIYDLDDFPNPYRAKNIDFGPYMQNLYNSNFHNKAGRYFRIYSHKGCRFRFEGQRCVFCGRADEGYRFYSVDRFFQNLEEMHLSKSDFVFDVGDDLSGNIGWLEAAVKYKENEGIIMPQLGIFGRGDEINEVSVALLRKLGVVDVTMGVESGDNSVLTKTGKKINGARTYYYAASLLFNNGIEITPSYVLGLPGETKRSVNNTIKHAHALYDLSFSILEKPPGEIVGNLLEPIPGSNAFSILEKAYPYKYMHEDELELETLQRNYFQLVFNLNYSEYESFRNMLREAGKIINHLALFADPQGWLRDEMD